MLRSDAVRVEVAVPSRLRDRARYRERRAAGVCVDCCAVTATARCAACTAYQRAASQRFAARRIAEGRCRDCGGPAPTTTTCRECLLARKVRYA